MNAEELLSAGSDIGVIGSRRSKLFNVGVLSASDGGRLSEPSKLESRIDRWR